MLSLLALSSGSHKPPHHSSGGGGHPAMLSSAGGGGGHPAVSSAALSSAGSGNGILSCAGHLEGQRLERAEGSLPSPLLVQSPQEECGGGSGPKPAGLRPYSSLSQPMGLVASGSDSTVFVNGGSGSTSASRSVDAGLQTPSPVNGGSGSPSASRSVDAGLQTPSPVSGRSSVTIASASVADAVQPPADCEEEEEEREGRGADVSAAPQPDQHSLIWAEAEAIAGVEQLCVGASASVWPLAAGVQGAPESVEPSAGVDDAVSASVGLSGVEGAPSGEAGQPPHDDDEIDCWHEVVIKAMVHPVDGR